MIQDICIEIRHIIETTVNDELFISIQELDNNDDLFLVGVDSLNVISIILRLEEFYEIEFEDNELSMENLKTIESIALMIEKKVHKM